MTTGERLDRIARRLERQAAANEALAKELRHSPAPSRIGSVEPLGDDDMADELEAHEIEATRK